jgi:diadenosine tetraphosphate (Ap4A) HIT family hydrolase
VISFNAEHNVWAVWHDTDVEVVVPVKTLWPASYGGWVIVVQHQQKQVNAPYHDYHLFAKMCVIAAVVQKGLERLELAPHANIQSNANWAFRTTDGTLTDLEAGRQQRRVHIHIFGRRTEDPSWGDPIGLASYNEYAAMQNAEDVWNETTLNHFSTFLADEVPRALKISQASF